MDEQALLQVFSREIVSDLAGRLDFGPRAANRLARTIADAAQTAAFDRRISNEGDAVRHAREFVEAFLSHSGAVDEGGAVRALPINDAAYTTALLAFCPLWPWRQ